MTTSHEPPVDDSDESEDQDAEPTLNTTADARPDGQDTTEDGGSTEDVI